MNKKIIWNEQTTYKEKETFNKSEIHLAKFIICTPLHVEAPVPSGPFQVLPLAAVSKIIFEYRIPFSTTMLSVRFYLI